MKQDLLVSNNWELLLWLVRKRKRFRVAGNSMLPLLKPGEEILVDMNAYRKSPPQVGDIVVASHPRHTDYHIIKRVAAVKNEREVFLLGDNQIESTDSRRFGTIKFEQIIGKVTSRFQ